MKKLLCCLLLALLLVGCSARPPEKEETGISLDKQDTGTVEETPEKPDKRTIKRPDRDIDRKPDNDTEDKQKEKEKEKSDKNMDFFGSSDVKYFVQHESGINEEYNPVLQMQKNGRFKLLANLYEGMGFISGSYEDQGSYILFVVTNIEFVGFAGDDLIFFTMSYEKSTLKVTSITTSSGKDAIGITYVGSSFVMTGKPSHFDNPKGLI